MLQTEAIVFCDRCDVSTARFERGWYAYVTAESGEEPSVTVVCPACAERSFGEDEAEWSD